VLIATTDHSSDGRLLSLCPSLLETIVAMGVFYMLLLWYTVATGVFCLLLLWYTVAGQLHVATVAYNLLLQWCAVVVFVTLYQCHTCTSPNYFYLEK
jgi:hypothetical protein